MIVSRDVCENSCIHHVCDFEKINMRLLIYYTETLIYYIIFSTLDDLSIAAIHNHRPHLNDIIYSTSSTNNKFQAL